MSNRAQLAAVMPAMLLHDGWWDGWYRDFDPDGQLLEERRVRTHCEFPDDGAWSYVQRNWIRWADGREMHVEFGGRLEGDRMIWRTDRFTGYGWQTHEHLIMLRLDRLDLPGACYVEMINLFPGANIRSRTWQWFRGDKPWKRTLCDEKRINP